MAQHGKAAATLAAACAVLAVIALLAIAIPSKSPGKAVRRVELMNFVPVHILVGGTETYPYWEEENTGNSQYFAQQYIDMCVRKLYPEIGCPGPWDSPVWGSPRDNYDDDHPELDIWPPE